MKNRIKQIRKEMKMTQVEFGEKIGVKGNTVTNYETGLRTPTAAVVLSICREFNVSEDWLRTGEGEMFIEVDTDDQIAAWMGEVMADEPESFRRSFVQLLSGFRAEDWDTLERHLLELQKIMEQNRKD